jgi:hypothetical protein
MSIEPLGIIIALGAASMAILIKCRLLQTGKNRKLRRVSLRRRE